MSCHCHVSCHYVTTQVFGVVQGDDSIGFPIEGVATATNEEAVMPYLNLLAEFRETVRKEALETKSKTL